VKRTLQAFILTFSLLTVPSVIITGCVTPGTEQVDSVAVNADKTIAVAFVAIDEFLLWERQNEAVVPPAVHQAAESLRREAPDAFRIARSVLRAYKERPNPEQAALLSDWLNTLQNLATNAQTHLKR
jgi:hypothetical protein